MEVTYIATAIAALLLLIWTGKKLNRYSEEHYYYTPIGLSTIFLAMIPYALLIAGFFFFTEDPLNQKMALIFGSLSVVGLFWWIQHQSSFYVALGAIIILMISGLLMLAVILLASGGRDDDYYYDD